MFREALNLDIFNLNYAYATAKLGKLSLIPPSGLPRAGILVRVASLFWHFLKSCREFNYFLPGSKQKHPILFCVASGNQKNSLLSIAEHVVNSKLVSFNTYGRFDDKGLERFPSIYIYLLCFPFFIIVIRKFLRARDYRRLSFHYVFDQYLLIYGYYLASRIWFRYIKPAGIVIASDHDVINRTLTEAARCEGIPTFFVQHASVTEKFPALFFSYALLEGEYALRMYERAGQSTTRVFLIGMPKADTYSQFHNNKPYVRSIGICTNVLDPTQRINYLCEYLREAFPKLMIHLRPHPADKRLRLWEAISQKYNLSLSNSKLESSFEFLKKVDAILAGDSNIILEATLMNVYPIYYDFAQTKLDWYGFQRNGLVDYFCRPEDISSEIKTLFKAKPSVRERARIYCATIGTVYDGRSAELACNLIRSLTSRVDADDSIWMRIPDTKLEAYQLNYVMLGSKQVLAN